MTRYYRAALTAAWLAGSALPALAQSAPMGAPSDTAPPAPLQTVSDSMATKDAGAARTTHVHRARHHRVATPKAATATALAATPQTGS